jgi:hypothetical protein
MPRQYSHLGERTVALGAGSDAAAVVGDPLVPRAAARLRKCVCDNVVGVVVAVVVACAWESAPGSRHRSTHWHACACTQRHLLRIRKHKDTNTHTHTHTHQQNNKQTNTLTALGLKAAVVVGDGVIRRHGIRAHHVVAVGCCVAACGWRRERTGVLLHHRQAGGVRCSPA